MEKKIEKNIFQKLVSFNTNLSESGGKNQKKLLEEQNCLIYYEDGVCEILGCLYYKSILHFIDIETGNEIKTTSFSNINVMEARGNALKALCGRPPALAPAPASVADDNAKSPTPARMPSEPSGGVPKGFKRFVK